MLSPLLKIPQEILERIALELALLVPHGPPVHIVPLLQTCRHIHRALAYPRANDLYARIFRGMFDVDAARRRFGKRALRSRHLADQLRTYCAALQRIRRADIRADSVMADLWTAFILLTENDGKNRVQLDWARLGPFVDAFVLQRLWENPQDGWPRDTSINALALWVMWGMTDTSVSSHSLPSHPSSHCLPQTHCSPTSPRHQYPSYYAPDEHFSLPLPDEWRRDDLYSLQTVHGYYPHYREARETQHVFMHYGQEIRICPPPITAAAKLLYFSRREIVPLAIPPTLPVDRAQALALGITRGQTQADIIEVNSHLGAQPLPPTDWDWKESLTPEQRALEESGLWSKHLVAPSASWDNDWERCNNCWDPWSQPELKGVVYTFGMLDGLWQGRLLIPEEQGYLRLIQSPHYPEQFGETSPFMSTWPLFMRLKEHHCINPEVPVAAGGGDDLLDDGIRNAWFPPVRVIESRGHVAIIDDESGHRTEHETYVEGRPNGHNPDTCVTCVSRAAAEEQELQERIRLRMEATPRHADFEDEFAAEGLGRGAEYSDDEEDTYESTCSGIRDIIFTGETDPNHGMAWGRFTFLGRVRIWDGLIALIRLPHEPNIGRTRWVFRGYIHYGKVLTGSWRGMTVDVGSIPWEGPFADRIIKIYAGKLFDSESREFLLRRVITVSEDSGLIVDVDSYDAVEVEAAAARIFADAKFFDLRAQTVLPGFVDAHVHFFLHPYSETSWEDQNTKEHIAERAVRATVHAKRTLLAGFTSVRDLGTEGAADADIALRKCISGPAPIIPGPRYFCATRAIVSTGSYGRSSLLPFCPKSAIHVNREGIDGVTGAEAADGVDECVKVVRRQIGAGADWIKVSTNHGNYSVRSRTAAVSSAAALAYIPTFSAPETRAMIDAAHQYGVKVAAHATNDSTVQTLVEQGIDSIEHGVGVQRFWDHHATTMWVPTLAVYWLSRVTRPERWEEGIRAFRTALEEGFDAIACGGDTGVFAHGDNALEMQLMAEAGADWRSVLGWATLNGWKCVRSQAWEGREGDARLKRVGELGEDFRVVGDNEVPFGIVKRGFAADIIASTGDFEADFAKAVSKESITFVMKGGRVYKNAGREDI
ncbi:hypothetical protein FA95DRAFT_1579522 [Auriscalpium vulgare]|uniref:Uncharacterized protein n=1 Tax=Auriscalpium vulgare TaxID=40419 RepID=A0ACB8SBS3_9AGAM|nr:hypothetical protein FA95DRAFT_1579522 [Auriscalpium vulgare]